MWLADVYPHIFLGARSRGKENFRIFWNFIPERCEVYFFTNFIYNALVVQWTRPTRLLL